MGGLFEGQRTGRGIESRERRSVAQSLWMATGGEWRPKGVRAGVGLFSIFISDSTGGAGRTLREFADDTELWGAATQQRDGTPGDLVTAFRYLKRS